MAEVIGDPPVRQGLLRQILSRCESIGENCEFGFVQRVHGLEPGGLLRWAVTPLPALIALLSQDFRGLYLFENLIPNPANGGMVRDTGVGIGFHSKLRSQNGVFLLDEDARHLLYKEEKEKIDYLAGKLAEKLTDPKAIFVYKAARGAPEDDVVKLHRILRKHSRCTLLYVSKPNEPAEAGNVKDLGNGLIVAYAKSFAPWDKVDIEHIDLPSWEDILVKAFAIVSVH